MHPVLIVGMILLVIFILYYFSEIQTPHELLWKNNYGISYLEEPYIDSYTTPIVILTPLYNTKVDMFRKRIEHLMSNVHQWDIYIYGLDSTNTTTIRDLYSWASSTPRVHLVEKLSSVPSNRTMRIASIRNALLNAVSPHTSSRALVLVYDGDHRGPMSKQGLFSACRALDDHQEWFGISSSGGICVIPGVSIVYDPFAFRSMDGTSSIPRAHWLLPEYTPVKSAFSGACVYRWNELRDFRYPTLHNVCEHVGLNLLMGETLHKDMVLSKSFHILVGHQTSVS